MEKEFEAYYSKVYACIFALLLLLFAFGIAMLSIFWVAKLSLPLIIVLSVLSLVFLYVFITTIRNDGVAVQITDNKLILFISCKKEPVVIPIEDISKISIHDGNGSFDISIKTPTQKISLHCFIKEERKKKAELIALLKAKGIKTDTFDLV